jgi:hypothetical protein
MNNQKLNDQDVPITEIFYMQKFMQIQRQNVVLSNKLRMLYEDQNIKNIIETNIDNSFFDILKETPA